MKSVLSTLTGSRVFRAGAVVALAGSMLVMAGCANRSASSSVYSYGQAQQEQVVRTGTVVSVRPVVIQNDKSSGAGMVAGGALGGVAGNAVGGGSGRAIATVGGVILGGLLGNTVENQTGKTRGLEITVRLDTGETRVVAQADDVQLASGQRVRLVSGGGPTRVVPM